MPLSKKSILFWAVMMLTGLSVILLNLKFPEFIKQHYQNKNFKLLNQLADVGNELSQDYYQGKIDDRLLGPMTNVISFLMLICFCFKYAERLPFVRFGFLIFIFLVISKFNILFYPPYGDAVGGPFAEALWLKDHHFNYAGLLQQPGYLEGGQKVYVFTSYPTYLAVLYTLIPNIKMFLVVNHLLVFAMTAIVVSLVRETFRRNLDGLSAALGSVFILAIPLVQSQTEAINMEMPQLFFTMLSVWALIRRKTGKALLWALLALSIKGLGVVICVVVFLTAGYLYLFDQNKKHDKMSLFLGILALAAAFLELGSKYFVNDAHVSQGMVKLFAGWASLRVMYMPAVFGVSAGLLGIYLIGRRIYQDRKLKDLYSQWIILLMCAVCLLLFLNFKAVSPRYKLGLQPFLAMSVILSVTNFSWLKNFVKPLLVMAVIFASLGSFGKYEHPLQANYHVLSERSLEYRNNVKLDENVIRFLEQNFSSFTIGAPFIYAQMLSIPDLGYVQKPFSVVQYGFPSQYPGIKSFEGLNKLDIMKTVWVAVAADMEKQGDMSYPVHPQDKIVREFMLGDNRATLFMGGFSIEQRLRIIQQLMLRQTSGKH